jgi:hypothetical protein
LRLRRGKGVGRDAGASGLVLVDPGSEILRLEIGKGKQQVGDVSLRIDRQDRHAVDRRFLDERQAQAGLAASGHADADGVCHQIAGVVEDGRVLKFPPLERVLTSKVEETQLFEVNHTAMVAELPRLR